MQEPYLELERKLRPLADPLPPLGPATGLCWNLRAEPLAYLGKLKAFSRQNGLGPERVWYERATAVLAVGNP